MTNFYFSTDDVAAWTNESSKTTSVARYVFVFVFHLVFMFTLHHMEHQGEQQKSKNLVIKPHFLRKGSKRAKWVSTNGNQ